MINRIHTKIQKRERSITKSFAMQLINECGYIEARCPGDEHSTVFNQKNIKALPDVVSIQD